MKGLVGGVVCTCEVNFNQLGRIVKFHFFAGRVHVIDMIFAVAVAW